MWTSPFSNSSVSSSAHLTVRQRKALCLVREAAEAAGKEGLDVWQFAVEIDRLHALDLSNTDLRYLLCWGYLEHAQERTITGSHQRLFHPLRTLALPRQTCFVLTAKGLELTSEPSVEKDVGVIALAGDSTALPCSLPQVPRWDGQLRRLLWQSCLIREFHRHAPNQELVLTALEEEGWPAYIDDPLPHAPGVDPKLRLHDTIKSLNRNHLQRILRFGGDGSGLGIRWFPVQRC